MNGPYHRPQASMEAVSLNSWSPPISRKYSRKSTFPMLYVCMCVCVRNVHGAQMNGLPPRVPV